MKLVLFSTIFYLLLTLSLKGQDIATDSKNKGTFTYYSPKKYRLDFNGKEFSLTIASLPILSEFTIGSKKNVSKKSNYYIQPSIINASDIVSLSDFSNFRPGLKVKIGHQTAVESISSAYKGITYAAGFNLVGSFDNIKLYNTVNNKIEKKYPLTYGVESNFTIFFPAKWLALAFNFSLTKGWNDNKLLNFKDISSGTITNGTIVAFEKFDGKYGELNTGINKSRVSLSLPITFWHINTVPYVVLLSASNDKPNYFVGLFTNILSKRIDFHSFKLPSTFGVGVDWINNSSGWSTPNFFIRGNINLTEF